MNDDVVIARNDYDTDVIKVQKSLSDYLGVEIDDFLYGSDAAIFGGAVRDSLANLEIHDVDVMALPRSARIIYDRLLACGFVQLPGPDFDIAAMYLGLQIINQPWTFKRNNAIVQIIRPRKKFKNDSEAVSALISIMSNVDLSCCGLAYINNPLFSDKLLESQINAIDHCKQKIFYVLHDNVMYQRDRIHNRIAKLEERGWKKMNEAMSTPASPTVRGINGYRGAETARGTPSVATGAGIGLAYRDQSMSEQNANDPADDVRTWHFINTAAYQSVDELGRLLWTMPDPLTLTTPYITLRSNITS